MKKAIDYYKEGYSCSESIIKSAIDKGLISQDFLPAATSFSGGMSSGCVCGAVAASQIVIGVLYGRNNDRNGLEARAKAKEFVENFKTINKAACCKVLTLGLEHGSPERKANCSKLVNDAEEILEKVLELHKEKV